MASDQAKSDMVMMFTQTGDKPVFAECALEKDPDDKFMTDFKPQTYDKYSNFFELKKFRFSFEVKDEDKSKTTMASGGAPAKKVNHRVQGDFASWRSADTNQAPDMIYPFEPESFTFERLIDAASIVFFKNCCESITFPTATIVKRVSRGGADIPQGFLKLGFEDVLITGLSWDDGDMTTEKCDFICRRFTLTYKQQLDDGSFGAEVPASWHYKTNALPKK